MTCKRVMCVNWIGGAVSRNILDGPCNAIFFLKFFSFLPDGM